MHPVKPGETLTGILRTEAAKNRLSRTEHTLLRGPSVTTGKPQAQEETLLICQLIQKLQQPLIPPSLPNSTLAKQWQSPTNALW